METPIQPSKNKRNTIIVVILVILIIVLVGVVIWQQRQYVANKESNSNQASNSNVPSQVSIKRGIYGTVTLTTGNCMPIVTLPNSNYQSTCKSEPVSRTIYIRQAAQRGESQTKLIRQVTADDDGFYQAELPNGTYSIFADDNGTEYCNADDGQYRCPVTVSGNLQKHDIDIDKASH